MQGLKETEDLERMNGFIFPTERNNFNQHSRALAVATPKNQCNQCRKLHQKILEIVQGKEDEPYPLKHKNRKTQKSSPQLVMPSKITLLACPTRTKKKKI